MRIDESSAADREIIVPKLNKWDRKSSETELMHYVLQIDFS